MSVSSPDMVDAPVETPVSEAEAITPRGGVEYATPVRPRRATVREVIGGMLSVPVAGTVALLVHYLVPNRGFDVGTHLYPGLLMILVAAAVIAVALGGLVGGLRRWMLNYAPLAAAAIGVMCVWELCTLKLQLLPMPYFPGPEAVLLTLVNDRRLLLECTWRSLALLMCGYAVGTLAGLVSGICIGWSARIRYWGMPVLKVIGPIPATAWIPLVMVLFVSVTWGASVFLIALAVWFPVTMLTASGVSNTKASYLDVARTFGASRAYLIFRVTIPAAMPSIFIGLFMGLGASFLTLVAAESLGVKSGLGWYIDWARTYAEYAKVYSALLIMAVFFSTIMTVLFKVRDWVLVWQKGVIKW